MPDLLILTGNCGVGKTTVANAWADARGGAAVHADDIHPWIRVRAVRQAQDYQERLMADVSIAAALNLIAQGLDVALDNVWKPAAMVRLRDNLSSLARVQAVRLACVRPINRARDAGRVTGRMGPRVDVLGEELDALAWPDFVRTVDSTGLTVIETLRVLDHR